MRFRYEAVRISGEALKGEVDATSDHDAYRVLLGQDLTPVSIEALVAQPAKTVSAMGRRVKARDKALVIRELATLLAAGVPLAEAAESIAEAHESDAVGAAFRTIHSQLRSGAALSNGLRECGLMLPPFVHQLAMAGELTGKLAPGLFAAAGQMEYEENLRQEIRNALIYPAILICSGIGATLLIFVVVVPKFAAMLQHSRAELPMISVWVLSAGLFVKANLLWIGLVALSLIAALVTTLSRPSARSSLMESVTHIPLVGAWLVDTEIGGWASMLGTLLENRVPIVAALELAQSGVSLVSLRQKLELTVKDLRAGKKLADSLKIHRIASPMVINLVRVGERSGELPSMLKTAASMFETVSRLRMKRLVILLEPISILLIGGAIGFIMAAIMLAITSMNNISF